MVGTLGCVRGSLLLFTWSGSLECYLCLAFERSVCLFYHYAQIFSYSFILFFLINIYLFIYLFISGCSGSSLLSGDFFFFFSFILKP